MKNSESLKKNRDFQMVYQQRNSHANRLLVMYVRKNQLEKNRLGISVSKKVGNSIIRHRIARLIKENYRLDEQSFLLGFDIVIIAREQAKQSSYYEIKKALLHLAKIHRVLK